MLRLLRAFQNPRAAAGAFAAVLAIGIAAACGEYITGPESSSRRLVRGLSFGGASDTLSVLDGDTVGVALVALDQKGVPFAALPPEITVAWVSSDSAVAVVMPDGRVASRGAGRARLTATAMNVANQPSINLEVIVRQVISGLALVAGETQSGAVGDTLAPMVVRVTDKRGAGVRDTTVTFAVIAPVGDSTLVVQPTDASGVASHPMVLGTRAGSYVVRARIPGSSLPPVTFTATASPGALASLAIARPAPTFATLGRASQLSVRAADRFDNLITAPKVVWRSDSTRVATVDPDGTVHAVGNGVAPIIVVAADSAAPSDTVFVTVRQVVATVRVSAPTTAMQVGGTMQLTGIAADSSDAIVADASLAWTSDSPSVATVSATGLVTAVAPGAATIAAASGTLSGSVAITVGGRPIARLAVSPKVADLEVGGDTLRITATGFDDTNAQVPVDVAWRSTATAVAAVDASGKVTSGANAGTALVIASAGALADTAVITVRQVVRRIDVVPSALDLVVDSTTTLVATPRDRVGAVMSGATIEWSSSAPAIATAGADGVVRAVSAGDATITARAGLAVTDVPVAVRARAFPTSCADAGGRMHAESITTEERWTRAEGPHHVRGTIRIVSGGKLVIEPGALICMDAASSLVHEFGGGLEAHGTADLPIRFMANDPEAAWNGLTLSSTGRDVAVDGQLDYVEIDRAGGSTELPEGALNVRGGVWNLSHVRITSARRAGVVAIGTGRVRLIESTVDGTTAGIGAFDATVGAGVLSVNGFALVDSGTVLRNNAGAGVATQGGELLVRGATVTGNLYPARIDPLSLDRFNPLLQRQVTGNIRDTIIVMATADSAMPVDTARFAFLPGLGYRVHGMITLSGGALIIDPGVTVSFDPQSDAGITVAETRFATALVATGTAARPIRFTSAAPQPAPGDWVGIRVAPSQPTRADFAHVIVEYAGANGAPALSTNGSLDSVIVWKNAGTGVAYEAGVDARITNSRIVRNRVGISGSAGLVISNSTVAGNGLTQDGYSGRVGVKGDPAAAPVQARGVWWGDHTGSSSAGGFGDATSGPVDTGSPLGSAPFVAGGARLVLPRSGNGQTGTTGSMLAQPIVATIFDDYFAPVAGATGSWSVENGGGELASVQSASNAAGQVSAQWKLGATEGDQRARFDAPLQFAPAAFTALATAPQALSCASAGGVTHAGGTIVAAETWARDASPHRVQETTVIARGGVLTIEAGALVCVNQNARIVSAAGGQLVARGTAALPIRFVPADPSARWNGLELSDAPSNVEEPTIEHVEVNFAGNGMETLEGAINVVGGSWTLADVQVLRAQRAGVVVRNGATARLLRTTIEGTVAPGGVASDNDMGAGVAVSGGTAVVDTGSIVRRNAGAGIVADVGRAEIREAEISGNGLAGVTSEAGEVAARGASIFGNQYPARFPISSIATFDVTLQRRITGNTRDTVVLKGQRASVGDGHIGYVPGLAYRVEGLLNWDRGTLTIDPGVTLAFAERMEGTLLIGTGEFAANLVAAGTASLPIRFTSASPSPRPGDWAGVSIGPRQSADASYRHWIVEYTGADGSFAFETAIALSTSGSVTLDSVLVWRNGGTGVEVSAGTRVHVTNSRIVRNRRGVVGYSGVSIDRSSVAGNGLPQDGFDGGYGIRNRDDAPIIARNVWWGDASGPAGAADGYGNAVLGAMDVDAPLAASPYAVAPGTRIVLPRSGDGQSAAPGATLFQPIIATAFDEYMTPVAGMSGSWAIMGGGGRLTDVRTITNEQGQVSARWQVGSAGDQEAQFTTAAEFSPVSFRATAAEPEPLRFVSIQNGQTFSCGLTIYSDAYCWGSDTRGALGAGATTSSTRPTRVETNLKFNTISARSFHACAIAENARAYCWGLGATGRLGTGDEADRNVPTPVRGGLSFTDIAAGEDFTCALTAEGRAYCWGYNGAGAVGDGTGTDAFAPVAVNTSLTFASITAGEHHACGLTSGGELYCWGNNVGGQLGASGSNRLAPSIPVSGRWTAAAAGGFHTCALNDVGAAYCWGHGSASGIRSTDNVPTPTPVVGGLRFATLAAGGSHTCAAQADGTAYCWGDNFSNQIGDGTNTLALEPVRIGSGIAFARFGLGWSSCGIDNQLQGWCWGANYGGEVGDGSMEARPTPTLVSQP